MSHPRVRVAAYVIRQQDVPELLVFDHVDYPEAGTQIPAGGVQPGESLEEAVLRETPEETGLQTARIIGQLAVEDKPHPQTGHPRRTNFFHLQASADTPDAWVHRVLSDGSDASMIFSCRFLPIPLQLPLADDQDTWLDRINRDWRTRTQPLG
ncbi:NUDIX domain-containing protein [Streptomyces sp. SID8356]|uniref:NUDIX hydrolase n=1 Tax=unclassified Streptomyces TaxID=2593676 RepID=UPI000997AA60|nr:NUDIX domain-containing protein [Streptomyces sp. CcalMP-8W]MYT36589.1 NUDIX domain-containing protein [Streptomyces sp. SID8356]